MSIERSRQKGDKPNDGDARTAPAADVTKRNRQLTLSLREAAMYKDDPVMLPQKVSDVIENLQHVTEAMKGEVDPGSHLLPGKTDKQLTANVPPRTDATADVGDQSKLLAAAEELARELRSQRFSEAALKEAAGGMAPAPPGGRSLPGERAVDVAFEIASYVALQDADGEGWGRKAASEATRDSSEPVKSAVKAGNYLLGPSPLMLVNDLTKLAGDAVKGINAKRLKRCVTGVAAAIEALPSSTPPDSDGMSVRPPSPDRPTLPTVSRTPAGVPQPVIAPRLRGRPTGRKRGTPPTGRTSVSKPDELPPALPRAPRPPSSDRNPKPPSSPGLPGGL